MIGFLVALLIGVHTPLLLLPSDDCRMANFSLGPEDSEKFTGAVFRVDDGGDIGVRAGAKIDHVTPRQRRDVAE